MENKNGITPQYKTGCPQEYVRHVCCTWRTHSCVPCRHSCRRSAGEKSFLPDGKHFLYLDRAVTFGSARRDTRSVFVASLDSKEARPLVATNFVAAFSPGSKSLAKTPSYLLFLRDATLMAQEMDASSFSSGEKPFAVRTRSPWMSPTISLISRFQRTEYSRSIQWCTSTS